MTIQEEEAELLRLASEATPGPWEFGQNQGDCYINAPKASGPDEISLMGDTQYYPWTPNPQTMAYIAYANPERIKRLLEDDGWVSVDDRLPQPKKMVLTWCNGEQRTGLFVPDCTCSAKWHLRGHSEIPSHWRELPAPPKGASK